MQTRQSSRVYPFPSPLFPSHPFPSSSLPYFAPFIQGSPSPPNPPGNGPPGPPPIPATSLFFIDTPPFRLLRFSRSAFLFCWIVASEQFGSRDCLLDLEPISVVMLLGERWMLLWRSLDTIFLWREKTLMCVAGS